MDSTLVASFISVALSVITAAVSAMRRSAGRRKHSDRQPNNLRWISALFLLLFWLGGSPILIRWDIASLNIFVIIGVTLILALFFPIRAGVAAAIVMLLHPANFFLAHIGQSLHDVMPNPSSSSSIAVDLPAVVLLLSMFLMNAIVVFLVCLWRGRRLRAKSARGSPRELPIADDLERIEVLHSRGILTDEEFEAAKRRMLGS